MKILMVCLGNICRSPLAEGIMRKKIEDAGLNWIVDSAGTYGYKIGCAPHELSQKVALKNGIDISHQQCRKLAATDFEKFDRIYVMDNENYNETISLARNEKQASKVKFLTDHLFPEEKIDIPDPYYGGEENYHQVFDIINKSCEAVVAEYKFQSKTT